MNSKVKTNYSPFLVCSTAMLLACALVASDAFADDQVRSETVKFADLKVDTQAGVEALNRRIYAAAQRVCGYNASSVYGPSIWRNCVRPTIDATVAKANNPLLTQLHSGHSSPAVTAMNK